MFDPDAIIVRADVHILDIAPKITRTLELPGTRISRPEFVLAGLQRLLGLHTRADRWLPRAVSGRIGAAKAGWFAFCPACWAEDDVPYLRLHWRVGFLSTCPGTRWSSSIVARAAGMDWPRGASVSHASSAPS